MQSNVCFIQTFVVKAADTKQALLDAAEQLFAERGFAASSMRDITTRARVNLAAANYHFGGKRGLMHAVLERRITPLNEERLRQLNALEQKARSRSPRLEDLLEAFLGPAIRLSENVPGGGGHFVRLMGRMFIEADQHLHLFFMSLFQEVADRFIPAMQRALPRLPAVDLFWRLHFMIGCLAHTLGDRARLKMISHGRVDPNDIDRALLELVMFVAGGLRAPTTKPTRRRRR